MDERTKSRSLLWRKLPACERLGPQAGSLRHRSLYLRVSMSIPYKGIIPPLVTPLSDFDTLDVAGLERMIEHVIDGGVHGIFVLGTTGEGPSLSQSTRQAVIRESCRIIDGRLPVFAGISDSSFADSVRMAQLAADCGADVVVSAGQFYMPPNDDEIAPYFSKLADAVSLPLLVYNIPICTNVHFNEAAVRPMLEHANIIGIKDSSGNMSHFNRLIRMIDKRPDFTVLMGPEDLTAQAVMMGAHGAVCGGSNLFPKLFVSIYEAAVCADLAEVQRLEREILNLADQIYTMGQGVSGYMRGLKCALSCVGLCKDILSPPYEPLGADNRQTIADRLASLNGIEAVAGSNTIS